MEATSKRKSILIIGLLLVVLAIGAQVYVLAVGNKVYTVSSLYIVTAILSICSLVFAGCYIATGFKKTSAPFYQCYIYLFILAQLFQIVHSIRVLPDLSGPKFAGYFKIVISIFVLLLLCILEFGKNLGRKKSLIFAYSMIALIVINFVTITLVLLFSEENSAQIIKASCCNQLGNITLGIVLVSTIHMKYIDKKVRYERESK